MEVTYTLENNDYLQFNRFVINRVPALKRQALLRFFFLPVLIAVELYMAHTSWLPFLAIICAVTAAWIGYLWWAQNRAVITQVQARVGAIGLHTVSLQPDGLYNQTSVQDTRVKWQNISEVAENSQMILLFLSPRYGFIVPKRAFADPAQASAFLETARACRQSVWDGTQPALPSVPASWPPAPQRIL